MSNEVDKKYQLVPLCPECMSDKLDWREIMDAYLGCEDPTHIEVEVHCLDCGYTW